MSGVLGPGHVEVKATSVFGPFWDALVNDGGCCVLLTDSDLTVRYVNANTCIFLDVTASELIGRNYCEVLESVGIVDRRPIIQRVLSTGKPSVLRCTVSGQARVTTYRLVHHPELPGGRGVLMVCRENGVSDHVDPAGEVIDACGSDASPLSVLTDRELQVLRCIAEGLSSAEIARELHRSVKTVEGHRARLGHKLGARNRSELTRLAISFGLIRANRPGTRGTNARGL